MIKDELDKVLALAREGLALAEKATPGPWEIDPNGVNGSIRSIGPIYGYDYDCLEMEECDPDALFVAWSRAAVPELARALLEIIEEAHANR